MKILTLLSGGLEEVIRQKVSDLHNDTLTANAQQGF